MAQIDSLAFDIPRLFIGNFQVPILKKWIENDITDEQLLDGNTQEVLPTRDSSAVDSVPLSIMRRRGN